MLRLLAEAGMDAVRLNFSHGSHEDHAVRAAITREVQAELGRRLEGKADVRRVDDGLFPDVGDALRARLANLVVLPHVGEAAYWLDPPRFEQRFRGQHGGLSPDEMEIPLVSWVA